MLSLQDILTIAFIKLNTNPDIGEKIRMLKGDAG